MPRRLRPLLRRRRSPNNGGMAASGECDHFQSADLARLAEEHLLGQAVPAEQWEGRRFAYGAGGGSGPFLSVYMEVARRGGNWVVTRLDRRKTELTPKSGA